jgi:microcystin-dependent protein
MSSPFVAEIRIFAGNFAPTGWATCDGQILPISQNTALFSLLGTTYGGNGQSTFALPNLQGSAPMHAGQGPGLSERLLGEQGGEQNVTLLVSELPAHSHGAVATSGSNQDSPAANAWSSIGTTRTPPALYSDTQNTQMSPLALAISGGSLPHNNMSPYLCLTFIIALQGVFPPRS